MEGTRGRTSAEAGDQVVVFSGLWAIAHIGHLLRKADPTDLLAWLLMASAVLLVGKPSSTLRLGALAVMQLLYLGSKMPITDNHAYIMGFANLGLLVALLFFLRRRRQEEAGEFRIPRRYLAATFLISYAASALAKLNSGFFDLETSCAVEMFYDAVAVFGLERDLLPESLRWFESLLPYLIVGIEILIPVLLMIPRTRRLGVVVVVLFHFAMSLSPTATALDFTLVVFALLVLFLPAATASRLLTSARRAVAALPSSPPVRRATLVLLSSFPIVMLWAGLGSMPDNRNWVWLAATALALGAGLLILALTEGSDRSTAETLERRTLSRGLRALPYVILVALQLANISAPYLGSKNVGSFVMYSNLQTARGHSNHFLFPRLPIEMGQDHLVEIVASSNGWLRHVGERGLLISWHELRRHLSADPEASIAYRRRGVLHTHERARENPELVRRHPVSHFFIGHRLFDPRQASCRW